MLRTNRLTWALVVLSAFLQGCGDAKVAGGSGSDFPQPTARLLDSALHPVSAQVWRLWSVEGDSATVKYQVVDSNGFSLPGSGLWVVEAWADTGASGSQSGLRKTAFADTACEHLLTHLSGESPNRFGVLPCRDLPPPSLKSRPSSRPIGVGIFGYADTAHRVVSVPGGSAAFRFIIWGVRWDTIKQPVPSPPASVSGRDSVLIVRSGWELSKIRGLFDSRLPKGDWYVDGWNAGLDDTLSNYDWVYPPATRWLDSTILGGCFSKLQDGTSIGDCYFRADPSPWNKESDAHFVVRIR